MGRKRKQERRRERARLRENERVSVDLVNKRKRKQKLKPNVAKITSFIILLYFIEEAHILFYNFRNFTEIFQL